MAILGFSFLAASQIGTRAPGDYFHFRCDMEAELPASSVQNGDKATTLDSKKRWTRTAGAWVEDTTDPVAAWGKITGTLSGQSDLQSSLDGKAASSRGVPTGAIEGWSAAAAPSGWLLCDGAAVSRTTYAALFAVISTAFGSGDGSTTFNVPNMKGRVPVGLDSSQSEFDTIGKTGGSKTHTLTSGEMPSHTHTQDAHTHTQNSHNHTQDAHTHTQNSHNHTQDQHSHTVTSVGSSASGAATNLVGTSDTTSTTATTNNVTATNQAATATNQNATATNQAATATNQNATATNQNTGGGGAHNNIQPYLVLNYIIKT